MSKKFTKSDLKNGDVILRRNGEIEIVITDLKGLICVSEPGYNKLSDLTNDLLDNDNLVEWDVIAVRRPLTIEDCNFHTFDAKLGELVYDRNKNKKTTLLKKLYESLNDVTNLLKGELESGA